jgi:hypothetical protein
MDVVVALSSTNEAALLALDQVQIASVLSV